MKITYSILFIALVFFGSGDDKVDSHELIKENSEPKTTLSNNTELRASVISEVTVSTPSIQCRTCEKNILKAFNRIDGITNVTVDLKKKIVTVNYNAAVITVPSIKTIISNTGYDADEIERVASAYEKLDECCKDDSRDHN